MKRPESGRVMAGAAAAALAVCIAAAARDELLRSSEAALTPAQEKFIAEKVSSLRESDHVRRFAHIMDLVELGPVAARHLQDEIDRGSNPIPVRCSLLALAEIAAPGTPEVLSKVLKGDRVGRDEKAVAALGLGKAGGAVEAAILRGLLKKEERLVRRAAALGLGRMEDRESVEILLNLARHEPEERVAVVFLLAAALAGGETFASRVEGLLKSLDKARRAALVLGSAFEADPALTEALLRYGAVDDRCRKAVIVALGRYTGAAVFSYLKEAAASNDAAAALDAFYSLAKGGGDEAAGVLLRPFGEAKPDAERRCHALLAAADAGLGGALAAQALKSLGDALPAVRSAAALALAGLREAGAVPALKEALAREEDPVAAADLLLALGLLGGPQDAPAALAREKKGGDPGLPEMAAKTRKVLGGKMDRVILEEALEARLESMSGRWGYRFRSAFLEAVFYGMELDTIIQRQLTSGAGADETGSETGGGEGQGEGGQTEPEPPPDPDSGAGTGPGQFGQGQPPLQGGGSGGFRRRVAVRSEVVEWDLLHWFEELEYFPASRFLDRR